jgi:methionyl-tRNA formyltransferase
MVFDLIKHLQKKNIQVVDVFVMADAYRNANKQFFDRMDEAGLACDIMKLLTEKGQKFTVVNNLKNDEIYQKLVDAAPDLIINNGMMFIFPEKIVDNFRVLNTHSGRLPYYRGRSGASWAVYNDEKIFGVSCHLMDKGVDTGPVVAQKIIKITDSDYMLDLLMKERKHCLSLILKSVKLLSNSKFKPKYQSEFVGSYFPALMSDLDGAINWERETSRIIFCKVRAFSFPYGGAFAIFNDAKVVVSKASIPRNNTFVCREPGMVFGKSKSGAVRVSTADGHILIEKIIVEGSERSPSGYWKMGDALFQGPFKENVKRWIAEKAKGQRAI